MKKPKSFPKSLLFPVLVTLSLALPPVLMAADAPGPVPPNAGKKVFITLTPEGGVEEWNQEWIDNATGLPQGGHAGSILSSVVFDGLPVSEVAKQLQVSFSNQFDVLIPDSLPPFFPGLESPDPRGELVRLRLKNVTAGEIFNAMNLDFEGRGRPIRWELKMNGHRPIAIIRAAEDRKVVQLAEKPQPVERMILYVGDLLGEGPKGMTMDKLIKTLHEVYEMATQMPASGPNAPAPPPRIEGHMQTDLLIMSGTRDQLSLIQNTISMLKRKVEDDRRKAVGAGIPPVPSDPSAMPRNRPTQPAPTTP